MRDRIFALTLLVFASLAAPAHGQSYKYFRTGNKEDTQKHPEHPAFGIAMMGGGNDLDEAFRWLCDHGNGGDFLVLRARGDDEYNSYINGLCRTNSVATLILPDRTAADDPAVADLIRKAEVVFIAGGDQANYIRGWKGTAAQKAINEDIAAGKPIGGTSAGLAVLGEFLYSATGDKPDDKNLASSDVLPNPYFDRVTLDRDFLKIPHLENTITDSHFAKRDRMGRSLGFLARLVKDGWSWSPREIAIDERSAVLVDADGKARVVGTGKGAYFLQVTRPPQACEKAQPLMFREVKVYRVSTGGHFDLNIWKGENGAAYSLSVVNGRVESTQARNATY